MSELVEEFVLPIRQMVERLSAGELLGLATDTTYALVAAISSRRGVTRLRELRNLPPSRPLSLLFHDLTPISRFAFIDRTAYRLVKSLIPGHYTFILRATKEVPRLLLNRQRTVGIRFPGRPLVTALCEAMTLPLVSASAALPDGGYAESAEALAELYPDVELVANGGHQPAEPSTVIDLTGPAPVLVRQGAGKLPFEM